MPKYTISDIDETGAIQTAGHETVVFMPLEGVKELPLTLIHKASELTALVTNNTFTGNKLDFKICKHLLSIGFTVLIQGLADKSKAIDWSSLSDKSLYDITFLTLGTLDGATTESDNTFKNLLTCASDRGDCTAICNLDETASDFDYSSVQKNFASEIGANGEIAAGFTPAFYTKNSDLIVNAADETTKALGQEIPAAFGYLFAYANSIKNNPSHLAIAGPIRGIVPELCGVKHEYSEAEANVLQRIDTTSADANSLDGVAINPIMNVRPNGYIIYGNRTCVSINTTEGTTASAFLNLRVMLNEIKKVLYDGARAFTFEPNNNLLWVNYQAYVRPTLDMLQSGNGILGYRFVKLTTTDRKALKARLIIVPIEALENVSLEVLSTTDETKISE